MSESANIKLSADALMYLEQRCLKLFGKDYESVQLREWFRGLHTTALAQTASIQCLGMRDPVPFSDIYQPARLIVGPDPDTAEIEESFSYSDKRIRSILRGRTFNEKTISVDELLWRDHDALIFSGPGWGKTTLLHQIFRTAAINENLLPILITLRRPTAVADLERYVSVCPRFRKKAMGPARSCW
jgi:hypothetical protein